MKNYWKIFTRDSAGTTCYVISNNPETRKEAYEDAKKGFGWFRASPDINKIICDGEEEKAEIRFYALEKLQNWLKENVEEKYEIEINPCGGYTTMISKQYYNRINKFVKSNNDKFCIECDGFSDHIKVIIS